MNNKNYKKGDYRWNCIHNTKRQMLYNINEHQHEDRFSDDDDIRNKVRMIFQSDCDVINLHLNEQYNFDIIDNKYKYYLPNLMRHHGEVEKDQVAHWDYLFIAQIYKKIIVSRRRKNNRE